MQQRRCLCVRAATAWEIASKHRLGRLPGVAPLWSDFPEALRAQRSELLPIQHHRSIQAAGYCQAHRDSFDHGWSVSGSWQTV